MQTLLQHYRGSLIFTAICLGLGVWLAAGYAPHTPIQPPRVWLEKVKAREPGISDRRAKLVALIEHMDYGIGRVIDALKKNGQ